MQPHSEVLGVRTSVWATSQPEQGLATTEPCLINREQLLGTVLQGMQSQRALNS